MMIIIIIIIIIIIKVKHNAWGPFSLRKCRQFKVSAVFTSVCFTPWTPRGNAYTLLSWHFAPYQLISKIRVRKHNTGPITVLTLIDSYSLPLVPYGSEGSTRRLQATDRKDCDWWWRESNHCSSSDVYSLAQPQCTLHSLDSPSLNDLSGTAWHCHLLTLFAVDRYDICLGDNSSTHVTSVILLWKIHKKWVFVFLGTGRSKSHLTFHV
jgi:hypothetical protein